MLSSGSCQTIEEYKYQVGYIKGVKDALIWAKEINEKLIGNTDKARQEVQNGFKNETRGRSA